MRGVRSEDRLQHVSGKMYDVCMPAHLCQLPRGVHTVLSGVREQWGVEMGAWQ